MPRFDDIAFRIGEVIDALAEVVKLSPVVITKVNWNCKT